MTRLVATPALDRLVHDMNDEAAQAELERVHLANYYLSCHLAAIKMQTDTTLAGMTCTGQDVSRMLKGG